MAEATGAVEDSADSVTVPEAVTEDTGDATENTGAVFSALSAWWRAARRRFLSLSAGPRWRGR